MSIVAATVRAGIAGIRPRNWYCSSRRPASPQLSVGRPRNSAARSWRPAAQTVAAGSIAGQASGEDPVKAFRPT